MSTIVALTAVDGPLLVAVSVKVVVPLRMIAAGATVLVSCRSASWATSVVSVASLFDGSGSFVGDAVVEVLETVESAAPTSTVAWMSRVTESPLGSPPTEQVTVPAASVHGASAETNCTPAGRTSLSVTVAASSGPRLSRRSCT